MDRCWESRLHRSLCDEISSFRASPGDIWVENIYFLNCMKLISKATARIIYVTFCTPYHTFLQLTNGQCLPNMQDVKVVLLHFTGELLKTNFSWTSFVCVWVYCLPQSFHESGNSFNSWVNRLGGGDHLCWMSIKLVHV